MDRRNFLQALAIAPLGLVDVPRVPARIAPVPLDAPPEQKLSLQGIENILLQYLRDPYDTSPEPRLFRPNYAQRLLRASPLVEHPRVISRMHRRAGQTTSLIVDALLTAWIRTNHSVVLVAESQQASAIHWKLMDAFLQVNALHRGLSRAHCMGNFKQLAFQSGSYVRFLAMSQRKESFLGIRADTLLIDNAQALTPSDWRGLQCNLYKAERVRICSTPQHCATPEYYQLCMHPEQASRWERIHLSGEINPEAVRPDRLDAAEYRHEWLAEL